MPNLGDSNICNPGQCTLSLCALAFVGRTQLVFGSLACCREFVVVDVDGVLSFAQLFLSDREHASFL